MAPDVVNENLFICMSLLLSIRLSVVGNVTELGYIAVLFCIPIHIYFKSVFLQWLCVCF